MAYQTGDIRGCWSFGRMLEDIQASRGQRYGCRKGWWGRVNHVGYEPGDLAGLDQANSRPYLWLVDDAGQRCPWTPTNADLTAQDWYTFSIPPSTSEAKKS